MLQLNTLATNDWNLKIGGLYVDVSPFPFWGYFQLPAVCFLFFFAGVDFWDSRVFSSQDAVFGYVGIWVSIQNLHPKV